MTSHGETENCNCCTGSGYITKKLEVMGVCPLCKGQGKRDWVSHIMKRWDGPVSKDLQFQISMKNIELLREQIIHEGRLMGLSLTVKVSDVSDEILYRNINCNPYLMKRGT